MPETKEIPFLPGFTQKNISKTDFRKGHTLGYKNGYAVTTKPTFGIGGDELIHNGMEEDQFRRLIEKPIDETLLNYKPEPFFRAEATKPFIPAHVAYDKLVLSFKAYFKQTVHDSMEQYILRRVKIHVYLEDDSVEVIETPQENSGIPQGVLIKRQRLPKSEIDYVRPTDFNVGMNITIYGKTIRIIDCDSFTKKYLTDTLGIKLNPPEEMPIDIYLENRNKKVRNVSRIEHNDKLRQFLENDRKVLRFYALWDDRENMFGEIREFIVHYFLVDDCIEVTEVRKPNQGRVSFPVLLRRQQLPKRYEGVDITLSEKYTWRDLKIGTLLNVLGRQMLLYKCDDYTREYYIQNLGYKDIEMKEIKFNDGNVVKEYEREIPPYNGFGTLEDSLGSVKHLVLKPPKKDFVKMLENEHKVLRFVALMESTHKEDYNRKFIIAYRLSDDMLTIYEPPQRNAGFIGGKFLERTRVLKPGHTLQNPEYYNAVDLNIGATVEINHYKFKIIDADEYVYNYMESNSHAFPMSDIRQELITIVRFYDSNKNNQIDVKKFITDLEQQ
ncbi:hypothetical protein ROZALSC1DRAFT_19349 [Rozella allomycis CSF55]|uniref:DM10 domain-containing protein n=1 Tax=Rozella allomycis (strain CSF55) TaxID=988480 RepID=A0A4P9YKF6_ROZAC|nr:hypothetical protein ROZALSC1DRAFT_19349 [Rozella allomycis CSF55]